jgi:hypothetical protein
MPVETRPYDPARYLTSEEAIAAYLDEARRTGDASFIEHAEAVVARAPVGPTMRASGKPTASRTCPTISPPCWKEGWTSCGTGSRKMATTSSARHRRRRATVTRRTG